MLNAIHYPQGQSRFISGKTKILFLLICNLIICNLQYSQNITNTLGSSGTFTIKDGSTSYLTLSQSTGSLSLSRDLVLPVMTAGSQYGAIYRGSNSFIHNYRVTGTTGSNIFMGINSGNFTMTGGSITLASYNTAVGDNTLSSLTTGYQNSAFGNYTLFSNTTGYNNSAFGLSSLYSNTTGRENSAFGSSTLLFNTSGSYNAAFGINSLRNNTSGDENSAFGRNSLMDNTTGDLNSSFGSNSLSNNTIGNFNSSFGSSSLTANTSGNYNAAYGYQSLLSNQNGTLNSSFGSFSLRSNTSGSNNSAFGNNSLSQNTSGNYNSAFGVLAGSNITNGSNLTLIGFNSQPSTGTATNQITLGDYQISSLRCNVQMITSLSDARDKKNISELSLGLDFITKLKPRQFNWDKREWYDENVSDGSKMTETPTAGFIAQELDEAQTSAGAEWLNLVLKDNPDKWEATYGNLLPVMVKAIQELKTENDELKDKLAQFENMQNVLAGEIEKLKNNGIKEVNSQIDSPENQ